MILEKETIEKFGYNPSFLGKFSERKIIYLCDYCGKVKEKTFDKLVRGHSFIQKDSCGECRGKKVGEIRILQLDPNSRFYNHNLVENNSRHRKSVNIGDIFGSWAVIDKPFFTNQRGKHVYYVKCKCSCGVIKNVLEKNLRNRDSTSCSCSRITAMSPWYKTRIYNIWKGMIDRCYNDKSQAYRRYGGRGIMICDEWKNDFLKFKDWALNHGYNDGLTIERKNPDSNYCPENCEWITRQENSRRVTVYREQEKLELLNKITELEKKVKELEKCCENCE